LGSWSEHAIGTRKTHAGNDRVLLLSETGNGATARIGI
jgi:hypothetical protein